MDLDDLAGIGTGDFDHRLVGLQLDHAVVGRNHVSFADQHGHHVPALDVFAQFRESEFGAHRIVLFSRNVILEPMPR